MKGEQLAKELESTPVLPKIKLVRPTALQETG